jgi:hypothetical protein
MEGSIVDFTIFGWIRSQEQIRTNFSSKRMRVMTIRTAIGNVHLIIITSNSVHKRFVGHMQKRFLMQKGAPIGH